MTFDVLYSPNGDHEMIGGRDVALVLAEDGTIVYRHAYGDSQSLMWQAVEAELAVQR